MPLTGIDVSEHQGIIDWDKVKAHGIQFAMLRGGYGKGTVDKQFHRNARECNRVGIPFGIYWFSYGWNEAMARNEARQAAALAKQYKVDYPISFDLEYDTVDYAGKNGVTITKHLATKMAKAFCEEIKAAGYIPMNYLNLDYYRRFYDLSELPYDMWYAQYHTSPSISGMAIWQHSSTGSVPGINGNVDMNQGYKTYTGSQAPDIKPEMPAAPNRKPIIRDGQLHARNFAVPGLTSNRLSETEMRQVKAKVLQQGMNKDYKAGLALDGIWGNKSENALGKHYVKKGETQYMVTALEILLMLNGYDPKGVENPGIFGSGLEAAVKQYQADHGLTVDGVAGYNTFKSLVA